MTPYDRAAPVETKSGPLARLRKASPTRVQLVACSPAWLMAGWMLFTWDHDENVVWRLALAVFAGFVFQVVLLIGLALTYVTAALREPQVLGALLLVVGLWAYDGYRDRARERQLVNCLEGKATMSRIRAERGADGLWDDGIDLRAGGMGYAVKSCRAMAAEDDAGRYDEE